MLIISFIFQPSLSYVKSLRRLVIHMLGLYISSYSSMIQSSLTSLVNCGWEFMNLAILSWFYYSNWMSKTKLSKFFSAFIPSGLSWWEQSVNHLVYHSCRPKYFMNSDYFYFAVGKLQPAVIHIANYIRT